jgi:hypothetical protein
MATPKPIRLCIFCESKADSREHAIPKWVAKRFPELRAVELYHLPESTISTTRRQPIRFSTHRERIFCKGCNKHFKHLEDDALHIIEWMARGRAVQLNDDEQRLVAAWGAKTGYALIAAEKEHHELVPRSHMAWLRQHGSPHEDSYVGYGSWNVRAFKGINSQELRSPDNDEIAYRAYSVVLTFAKLALKVFGLVDSPIPDHHLGYDRPLLRQVWPPLDRSLVWPTPSIGHAQIFGQLLTLEALQYTGLGLPGQGSGPAG